MPCVVDDDDVVVFVQAKKKVYYIYHVDIYNEGIYTRKQWRRRRAGQQYGQKSVRETEREREMFK